MLQRLVLRISLLALAATALLAAPASAAPAVSGEFKLKSGIDTNSKITAGPDGNVWVTLTGPGEDVARITPAGVVTEFDLAVAGTTGITTGADGNLWVTRPGGLTRFTAANPVGTKTNFEIGGFTEGPIVSGPDGRLWFATTDKLLASSLLQPDEPQEVVVPGKTLSPKDIDVAGSLIVVADFGGNRVVTSTLNGKTTAEIKVGGGPQGVAGNPNGQFAVSQPSNEPREFILLAPSVAPILTQIPGQDPFGVALGADGAYWGAERNSNGLLRMTVAGQVSPLVGFAAGSEPRQITAGPNNTLWVTLPGAGVNSVGRVSGVDPPPVNPPPPPPPPPPPIPQTKIKGGPKGALRTTKKFRPVQFGFTSPDTVTSFECRMRKLAKKAGNKAAASKAKAKVPKFKGCASPKGYKLRPGRYSFEVRAVNDGAVDPTPAKRGFRIVAVEATASPQR